jgi:putative heme-binding domain-containing protein
LTAEIQARMALHDPGILSDKNEPAAIQSAEQVQMLTEILRAQPGDAYRGESLYAARCGSCHKLFFKGGAVGPDLTRYQRDDLQTLLHSIVDPSAEIREGYETVIAKMKDGRILSGFLAEDDANTVVLRGVDGSNTMLARHKIEDLSPVGRSLMPQGLLSGLDDQQLRDLFAYLKIPQPITK